MQATSNKKFKLNHCKLILAIMFTICMFTIAFPITAHADTSIGDNAGGSGSAGATGGATGGATKNNHGYRFYIVDSSGTVISDVIDFVSRPSINCDYNSGGTRIGNANASEELRPMPEGMPKPFDHDGHNFVGRGETLRQWCLAKQDDNENQNLVLLIHNYLGEDTLELFEDTAYEYYVVLEPITWHDIFTGGADSNTGYSFYGTFYNWMQFYNTNGLSHTFTSPLDQKVLGTCLQLVRNEDSLGLTDPGEFTEYFTLSNVGNQGWGMHLYYNQEIIETQTTCNEDEGDKPHPAPPESSGKVTIVKNYRYSEDNGATFIDGGCYVKKNTSGKIVIEEEPSYKIKEWRVSTDIRDSVFTLKWYDALSNYDENGTEACELNLKGEVALYILYEKITDIDTQTTCDENEGDKPHKAPQESAGNVTIVKNYRYSEDGGLTFLDGGCYVKENTSGKIKIEQERSYQIKEWRISTDIKHNVNSLNWESEVSNWSRKGSSTGIIRVDNDNVCLYILYEKIGGESEEELVESEYDFLIEESQITKRVSFTQSAKTSELITNAFSWTSPAHTASCQAHSGYGHDLVCTTDWDIPPIDGVRHTCTSSCPRACTKVWDEEPVEGVRHVHIIVESLLCSPGCTKTVEEKVVDGRTVEIPHVHQYLKCRLIGIGACTKEWNIEPKEGIAHVCTSSCPRACTKVWDVEPRSGTPHNHTDRCYGNPCTPFAFTDSSVKLGIALDINSVNKAVVSKDWSVIYGSTSDLFATANSYYGSFNRTSYGANTISKSQYNLISVMFRGNDKLTLAQWKNTATGKDMSYLTNISNNSANNFAAANTPQGTRKPDESYKELTNTKFVNDSPDIKTVYSGTSNTPNCFSERTYSFTNSSGASSDFTIEDIKVKIKVFWSNGIAPTSDANLPSRQTAGTVSFYPYFKMRYDTGTRDNLEVYVLGQNQRTATFYDYASVGINGDGKIAINSNQWSTHASAQKNILDEFSSRALTNAEKERVKSSILPGGATLSIAAHSNSVRTISVVTMQAYLTGAGKTQVDVTGGSNNLPTNRDSLEARHNNLVNSVSSSTRNVYIAQYIQVGAKLNASEMSSSQRVIPGTEFNGNGTTFSEDSKYHFNGYTETRLNVNIGTPQFTTYTFYVNAHGEIWCATNNTSPTNGTGIKVADKGSDTVASTCTGVPALIANNTGVVTALRKALIDNTGNDIEAPWAADGKWYNEAFDGITYLYGRTNIGIGIWDPLERTTVLDPKTTPSQSSKEDFFTKFNSSYFRSTTTSGDRLTVGTFTNSAGNGRTLTLNFGDLYQSDVFYIPNVTTQDLR